MDEAKKEGNMAADGVNGPVDAQTRAHSDELVRSVSLHSRRPRVLHGTVYPFLLLYPGCFYMWFGVYGASEYVEAGLLALAAIGIAHVLTMLSGYWSVHAHCWLTCSKVMNNISVIFGRMYTMNLSGNIVDLFDCSVMSLLNVWDISDSELLCRMS